MADLIRSLDLDVDAVCLRNEVNASMSTTLIFNDIHCEAIPGVLHPYSIGRGGEKFVNYSVSFLFQQFPYCCQNKTFLNYSKIKVVNHTAKQNWRYFLE